MAEPPAVMGAHIARAPFAALNDAARARQCRVIEPVVAVADDLARIAPVVVGRAARSEVDIAAACLAGRCQIVATEVLPLVAGMTVAAVDSAHNRFGAMA